MHIQNQSETSAVLVGDSEEIRQILLRLSLPTPAQVTLIVEFDGTLSSGDVRADRVYYVASDGTKKLVWGRSNHEEPLHDVCAVLRRINLMAAHQRRRQAKRVPIS